MRRVSVLREDGIRGTAVASGVPGRVTVKFGDGSLRTVSSEALLLQPDGTYRMSCDKAATETDQIVVPVIAEELAVKTHRVERGKVQIHKRVEAHEEIVYTPTICEQVHIERISINKLLNDVAPEVREENGVLIIPLVEEVQGVEKRLMLREEIRISKRRFETITPRKVVLRREVVDIVRHGFADGTPTINQPKIFI